MHSIPCDNHHELRINRIFIIDVLLDDNNKMIIKRMLCHRSHKYIYMYYIFCYSINSINILE
jgi:hypothetical protein